MVVSQWDAAARRVEPIEPVRPWHHVVDHGDGIGGDAVDNMVDADGARNVVDEEEQPSDAGQR